MTPYSEEIWDERELWSRDRIADFQLDALKRQLAYVHEHSRFYRRRFDEAGFAPGDLRGLDDLARLPTTRKADYVAALEEEPPWGTALALDLADVRRVHYSSGTTARPAPVAWSAADLDRWTDLYARSAYSQGVRAHDVYQCLFGFSWFVGGLGVMASYERIGCTCIPGGNTDSKRQLDTMFHYGTTAVGGTPSFALHLIEVAAEMGVDLRDTQVSSVMVGGEPGGSIPATRERIEDCWGAACYDGYGSHEFQPIAWDCRAQRGGHLAEDFLYAEVVDIETGEPVPDGTPGVLVLTHLDKQACPMVRWWTGDVVVRDASPCACGRTHARLPGGVRGRADDMLIVRGVNVFPSAVEQVIRRTPGCTGEYAIVVSDDLRDPATGYLTGLNVRVEAAQDATEGLVDDLTAAIRAELTVRANVELVPPNSLPRSGHKAKRVIEETQRA